MKYTILTLFPEITDAYFANSIMAKAVKRGIIEYQAINIRDFAKDKHKTCDDAPYGGGPGMLMLAEPLAGALKAAGVNEKENYKSDKGDRGQETRIRSFSSRAIPDSIRFDFVQHSPVPCPSFFVPLKRVLYLTPSGRPFTQEIAREFAASQELVLICGRYEGIDQRIIDRYVDDEISVGNYVLSSGEVAALAIIDATYRLVDRVICGESLEEESFSSGLLEYPQFTRPEEFDTMKVPQVLLSGHHEQIRLWRLEKRIEKTLMFRPDLIRRGREQGIFNDETNRLIDRIIGEKYE